MIQLKHEMMINAPAKQVWAALTEPSYLKELYMGSVIESTFQVGDSIQYVGPGADGANTVHVYGKILAFEPYQKFSFTHYVGKAYAADAEQYESRVTYDLEQVDQATKLTLIHDQWKEEDPSYTGSKDAWPVLLANTKSLIENGFLRKHRMIDRN